MVGQEYVNTGKETDGAPIYPAAAGNGEEN